MATKPHLFLDKDPYGGPFDRVQCSECGFTWILSDSFRRDGREVRCPACHRHAKIHDPQAQEGP